MQYRFYFPFCWWDLCLIFWHAACAPDGAYFPVGDCIVHKRLHPLLAATGRNASHLASHKPAQKKLLETQEGQELAIVHQIAFHKSGLGIHPETMLPATKRANARNGAIIVDMPLEEPRKSPCRPMKTLLVGAAWKIHSHVNRVMP